MFRIVGITVFLVTLVSGADYQVTIYPTYLSQGGRTHFETDRWDGHNGLDIQPNIERCKAIATESGRWLNRDLNWNIFQNVRLFIYLSYFMYSYIHVLKHYIYNSKSVKLNAGSNNVCLFW